MQARIKRIATEAEVKASSIRSHKNAEGEIFVGGVLVRGVSVDSRNLPLESRHRYWVNEGWLAKCSPRQLAIARYHGLLHDELGVLSDIATFGYIEAIDNIFRISDVALHEHATRAWLRRFAKIPMATPDQRNANAMQNSMTAPDNKQQQSARDYGNSLANANKTPIDPPLKPLGEWIPPKTTLWQKIRVWIQAVVNDHDLLMEIGKLKMMLDQRYIEKSKAERAFISVARPRYMNNSLPQNDRVLYEALCDFHGEEKLDEIPF